MPFEKITNPDIDQARRFNPMMLDNPDNFNAEIIARIREIREAMDRVDEKIVISVLESRGYTVTKTEPEAEAEVDNDRWRCLEVGCNPTLYGEPAALKHSASSGHRVAKWPRRSAEGKRRERERNRSGYHQRYRRDRDERDHEHGEDDFHGGDYGQ